MFPDVYSVTPPDRSLIAEKFVMPILSICFKTPAISEVLGSVFMLFTISIVRTRKRYESSAVCFSCARAELNEPHIITLPPMPKASDSSHIMHSMILSRNFILNLQTVADLVYGHKLVLPADFFAHTLNVDINCF